MNAKWQNYFLDLYFPRLSGGLDIGQKFLRLNISVLAIIAILGLFGCLMLYSAGGGNLDPWAGRHFERFVFCFILMLVTAMIDVRRWLHFAPLCYLACLLLLVVVEVKGTIGMGAQRWIDFGFFQLQPSELMKISLILILARHYHSLSLDDLRSFFVLIIPGVLTLLPVILVLNQPNLGTAAILIFCAAVVTVLAGVHSKILWTCILAGLSAIPLAWRFLHDYQKQRVLTFFNPEADPLGSGYHILQSKIALGSGGIFGKGFMDGTQSHLNFLPEMQTDFIFTVIAEEFGLFGAAIVIFLYSLLILYGYLLAYNASSQFARLLAAGLSTNLFLYMFINTGMVMGLLPVVGVPIPLLSYGGTSMLTVMIGFGLLLSLEIHRDIRVPLRGTG